MVTGATSLALAGFPPCLQSILSAVIQLANAPCPSPPQGALGWEVVEMLVQILLCSLGPVTSLP